MMTDTSQLVRLLQLASPALPVGAYSYSQGLEAAVETGFVRDSASAEEWIADVLELSVACMEGPLLLRLYQAFHNGDDLAVARWNELFLASRETAELRAETLQMGYSLTRLLGDLIEDNSFQINILNDISEVTFPAAYGAAAAHWEIPAGDALLAYLWAWLENQVMAAVKSIPLGQTDGQKILLHLGGQLPATAARIAATSDDTLGNFTPGLALLSSRHETQYSRLFRS
jgi:urease accessory protein